jgi:hypothetical protein
MSDARLRRRRKAAAVAAATLGLVVFTAGALAWRSVRLAPPAPGAGALIAPDAEALLARTTTVRVTLSSGAYRLERRGAVWLMPERGDYPVRPDAIAALARGLEGLRLDSPVGAAPERLAALGLDDPREGGSGALLELLDPQGRALFSRIIGVRPGGTFVRAPGAGQGHRAEGALPPLQEPAAWLDLAILSMRPEAVARVDVVPLSGPAYAILATGEGEFAPLGRQAFSQANAVAAATALTRWRPVDVRPAASLPPGPVARHMTTSRGGLAVLAQARMVEGQAYVTLRAQALRPEAQEAADALNARAEGWAFALAAYDVADYLFTDADMAPGGR